jgi:hypothetical protein
MKIPINPDELPTDFHPETDAELLALAEAGDWMGFFALCPEAANPDGADGLSSCLMRWCRMRDDLGLRLGVPIYRSPARPAGGDE